MRKHNAVKLKKKMLFFLCPSPNPDPSPEYISFSVLMSELGLELELDRYEVL